MPDESSLEMKKHIKWALSTIIHGGLLFILLISACNNSPAPKPRGFFRIALPEKAFKPFDNEYPYTFEYPVYGVVMPNTSSNKEPWWADIVFPEFRAKIHLSYKPINNNLANYLNDTHTMVGKLIPKATGIREDLVSDAENNVYGIIFHISGSGVASTCQFFVTDSTNHFLRGALYFNVIPNNDSLNPVIEFLKEDIQHMIASLRWK